jgi:hypothetical protein
MNTTKNTRRTGATTAIALGFALALAPITAHASQAGAAVTMLPTGPDIAFAAPDNLRQAIEADRVAEESAGTAAPTLRQLMEADHHAEPVAEEPADTAPPTLRQMMEADGQ